MPRARKDGDPLGLAGTRLSFRHGAFYYRHRDGKWERLGTDVKHAKERATLYNDPSGVFGAVGYWLDMFIVDCTERVKNKDLSERTLKDYTQNLVPLKVFFGSMLPEHITPTLVQQYLEINSRAGRPVRANREKSCLSSCLSWLIRTGRTTMIVNPCMQASGIKSNAETTRERYVTHEEYRLIHAASGKQVRLMMDLTYRTLQRPESDILYWTPANLAREEHSKARILKHRQNKTRIELQIRLTPEMDAMILAAMGEVPVLHQPLVHNRKGEAYTYTGITAMLSATIRKVNAQRKKDSLPPIPSFGFRDLKGKGATDMWLSGVPIEQIQLLCGHKDKTTTEKYIKARWTETANPNMVSMA